MKQKCVTGLLQDIVDTVNDSSFCLMALKTQGNGTRLRQILMYLTLTYLYLTYWVTARY